MSNSENTNDPKGYEPVSRRDFLATTGTGLAALATVGCAPAQQDCIDAAAAGATAAVATAGSKTMRYTQSSPDLWIQGGVSLAPQCQ